MPEGNIQPGENPADYIRRLAAQSAASIPEGNKYTPKQEKVQAQPTGNLFWDTANAYLHGTAKKVADYEQGLDEKVRAMYPGVTGDILESYKKDFRNDFHRQMAKGLNDSFQSAKQKDDAAMANAPSVVGQAAAKVAKSNLTVPTDFLKDHDDPQYRNHVLNLDKYKNQIDRTRLVKKGEDGYTETQEELLNRRGSKPEDTAPVDMSEALDGEGNVKASFLYKLHTAAGGNQKKMQAMFDDYMHGKQIQYDANPLSIEQQERQDIVNKLHDEFLPAYYAARFAQSADKGMGATYAAVKGLASEVGAGLGMGTKGFTPAYIAELHKQMRKHSAPTAANESQNWYNLDHVLSAGAGMTGEFIPALFGGGSGAPSMIAQRLGTGYGARLLTNTLHMAKTASPQIFAGYVEDGLARGYGENESINRAMYRTPLQMAFMSVPGAFVKGVNMDKAAAGILKGAERATGAKLAAQKFAQFAIPPVAGGASFATASLSDSYLNHVEEVEKFNQAKEKGEIPADAQPPQFDYKVALDDALQQGGLGLIWGTIERIKSAPGTIAPPSQAKYIYDAVSMPEAFDLAIQKGVKRGRFSPEQGAQLIAFREQVTPFVTKAIQEGYRPHVAAQIGIEQARYEEAAKTISGISAQTTREVKFNPDGTKTEKVLAPDETTGIYTEEAGKRALDKIKEIQETANESARTLAQLKEGSYIRNRTVSGNELLQLTGKFTPEERLRPEQAKAIIENGPYFAETVNTADFNNDPRVLDILMKMEHMDALRQWWAEYERSWDEQMKVQEPYLKLQDREGKTVREAAPMPEDVAKKVEEIKTARRATFGRYESLFGKDVKEEDAVAQAKDILNFKKINENSPIIGQDGKIIDGIKRIANALANGQKTIEVVKPRPVEELLQESVEEFENAIPREADIESLPKEHQPAAEQAQQTFVDISSENDIATATMAAATAIHEAGIEGRDAVEVLQSVLPHLNEAQAEAFVNVAEGKRELNLEQVVAETKQVSPIKEAISATYGEDIIAGELHDSPLWDKERNDFREGVTEEQVVDYLMDGKLRDGLRDEVRETPVSKEGEQESQDSKRGEIQARRQGELEMVGTVLDTSTIRGKYLLDFKEAHESGDVMKKEQLFIQHKRVGYSAEEAERLYQDRKAVDAEIQKNQVPQDEGAIRSINARYDAELAALEAEMPQSPAEEVQTEAPGPKKVNYITDSGNLVYVDERGRMQVSNKNGEPISDATRRAAILEAAENYDFTQGDRLPIPEDVSGWTQQDYENNVVEHSTNPSELAIVWAQSDRQAVQLSKQEQAIVDHGIQTTTESFDQFGDRNLRTQGLAKSYLRKNGTPIDEIAREVSDKVGYEVTPQDVVDFMVQFPGGIEQATRTSLSDVALRAGEKFRELTGFELSDAHSSTRKIAEIAIDQYRQQEAKAESEAQQKAEQELLEHEYLTRAEAEREYERAIRDGLIHVAEEGNNGLRENEAQDAQQNKVEGEAGSEVRADAETGADELPSGTVQAGEQAQIVSRIGEPVQKKGSVLYYLESSRIDKLGWSKNETKEGAGIQDFARALAQKFGTSTVVIVGNEQTKKLAGRSTDAWKEGNTLYINLEHSGLKPTSLLEEMGHLWIDWAKENATEIHDAGIALAKESDLFKYMQALHEGREGDKANLTPEDVKMAEQYVKAYGKYSDPLYSLANEVLAKAIRSQGREIVGEKDLKGKLGAWLESFWKSVKKGMGFSTMTSKEFATLDLQTFARRAAEEIGNGRDLTRRIAEETQAMKERVRKKIARQASPKDSKLDAANAERASSPIQGYTIVHVPEKNEPLTKDPVINAIGRGTQGEVSEIVRKRDFNTFKEMRSALMEMGMDIETAENTLSEALANPLAAPRGIQAALGLKMKKARGGAKELQPGLLHDALTALAKTWGGSHTPTELVNGIYNYHREARRRAEVHEEYVKRGKENNESGQDKLREESENRFIKAVTKAIQSGDVKQATIDTLVKQHAIGEDRVTKLVEDATNKAFGEQLYSLPDSLLHTLTIDGTDVSRLLNEVYLDIVKVDEANTRMREAEKGSPFEQTLKKNRLMSLRNEFLFAINGAITHWSTQIERQQGKIIGKDGSLNNLAKDRVTKYSETIDSLNFYKELINENLLDFSDVSLNGEKMYSLPDKKIIAESLSEAAERAIAEGKPFGGEAYHIIKNAHEEGMITSEEGREMMRKLTQASRSPEDIRKYVAEVRERFGVEPESNGLSENTHNPVPQDASHPVESNSFTTSLMIADRDRELGARGMDEMPPVERRALQDIWQEAGTVLDKDINATDKLIAELRNSNSITGKKRALVDSEVGLLLRKKVSIQEDLHRIDKAIVEAEKNGDAAGKVQAMLRRTQCEALLTDFNTVVGRAVTETARGLKALQMMANDRYDMEVMTISRQAARGGELTEADRAEIKRTHEEILRLKSELSQYQQGKKERESKQAVREAVERKVRATKRTLRATPKPTDVKQATKSATFQQAKAGFADVLRKLRGGEPMFSLPSGVELYRGEGGTADRLVNDMFGSKYRYLTTNESYARSFTLDSDIGGTYTRNPKATLRRFMGDFGRVYEATAAEFREAVSKDAKKEVNKLEAKDFDAYNDKLKAEGYDAVKINRREPIVPREAYRGHSQMDRGVEVSEYLLLNQEAVREHEPMFSLPERHESVVPDNPELHKYIKAAVNDLIEQGQRDVDAILEAVAVEFSEHLPEITARDIADIYSGYGKISEPKKDELSSAKREIKTLARLSSAIEDVGQGLPPLRTGYQPGEKPQAVREAETKLRDLLAEAGIQTTDPEKQMKTALDAAIRATENQIEDLTKEIVTGQRRVRPESKLVPDERLISLRAQRDELRAKRDELLGKKELTDEQRINLITNTLERAIADKKKRIESGQVEAREQGRSLSTPEIEALRKQSADLTKQIADMRKAANPGKTKEQIATEAAMRATQKRIDELDALISSGTLKQKGTKTTLVQETPELKKLRAERDQKQEEYDKMWDAANPKKTKEEIATKAAIKATEKSIAALEEMLRTGNLDGAPKQSFVQEDAALVSARARRDMLRKRLNDLRQASPTDAMKQAATETSIRLKQKALEAINRKIQTHDLARKQKTSLVDKDNAQLQSLNEALKTARETFKQMREEAGLTLQEKKERWAKMMQQKMADIQARIDAGDFEKQPTPQPRALDSKELALKAQLQKVKDVWDTGNRNLRMQQRTGMEKGFDHFAALTRNFKLSGIYVVGKLSFAAMSNTALKPVKSAWGNVLAKALPGIAAKAYGEGSRDLRKEITNIVEGFIEGTKEFGQIVKTGESELDRAYGTHHEGEYSFGEGKFGKALNYTNHVGHLHQALKNPLKRATFKSQYIARLEAKAKDGIDIFDEMVQLQTQTEAYNDGLRSIFMNDNKISSWIKNLINSLEKPGEDGHAGVSGKFGATILKALMPFTRVPTNIANEIGIAVTGTVTGSAKAIAAYRRGIDKLKPEEADHIFRLLKSGNVGLAFMLLGWLASDEFGGFYRPGRKEEEGAPHEGEIGHLPKWMFHAPTLEAAQFGANIRQIYNEKVDDMGGVTAGSYATFQSMFSVISQVPLFNTGQQIADAIHTSKTAKKDPMLRGFGRFGTQFLIGNTVPLAVQDLGKITDKETPFGATIKRYPDRNNGTLNYIKEEYMKAIPGLRQKLSDHPKKK